MNNSAPPHQRQYGPKGRKNAPLLFFWAAVLTVGLCPTAASAQQRLNRNQVPLATVFSDTAAPTQTFTAPQTFKHDDGVSFRASDDLEGARLRSMRALTTTASPTPMSIDPGGVKFLQLSNNSYHGYTVTVVARATAGVNVNKMAMFVVRVSCSNTGGTTALAGDPWMEIITRQVSNWDLEVLADDVNDRLIIRVIGDAGSTVRWAASVLETTVTN